jgi:hypothetical protein
MRGRKKERQRRLVGILTPRQHTHIDHIALEVFLLEELSTLIRQSMLDTRNIFNHSTTTTFGHFNASLDYNSLADRMSTIIYSMIYASGFLGNFLAALTFSNRRLRHISSSIFLLILSISDTISLTTSIWFFLADAFAIHLQNYSALACRIRTFFAYVFMDLSSWCIAGLAFDRYLRTKLPLNSKALCTSRNACKSVLATFLVLCVVNGHYFSPGIGQERAENRTMAHCLENRDDYPNYYYFYKIIWPKIDLMIFCFLPACIMILCNVKIIHLLKRQRHHMECSYYQRDNHDGSSRLTVDHEQTFDENTISTKPRSSIKQRKAIERQMSLMMAACVIVFLCTTLPVTIYLILLEHVITTNPDLVRNNAFFIFLFRMLRALMYTHFGSNFYLYCLTSRIFRTVFMQTIVCRHFHSPIHHEATACIPLNNMADV